LFRLPLVLIAPLSLKVKTAADLWRSGNPAETLISLPPEEVMVKQFHARLTRLGVNWPTGVEVSAMDLVPVYVSLGFGVGLSLATPDEKSRNLRTLPLPQFPPVVIAVLWQRHLSAANAAFLEEIRKRAAAIAKKLRS